MAAQIAVDHHLRSTRTVAIRTVDFCLVLNAALELVGQCLLELIWGQILERLLFIFINACSFKKYNVLFETRNQ